MDLLTYLTSPSPGLDPLGWVLFIAQIVAAIVGVYFAFLRGDTHPVRGPALQRLGYALIVLGALGTLLGALRLAAVEPFTAPFWLYLIVLFEIVLGVYALIYARTTYPTRVAEYEQASRSGRRRAVRPQPALQANGNGTGAPVASSRPLTTSSRRDARRDRKRRGR